MIITRKIGSLVRGKATPFQIYAACVLGSLLGFLPGFAQAPGLVVLWTFLLLILNANLFLAGLVFLLGKLVFLLSLPVLFAIGRILLEGPTQGLFKALINAPVTAYSGLDYYVAAGGQPVALLLGLALGSFLSRSINSYRRKMAEASENSERLQRYSTKKWVKVMKFVFLGSGRGRKTYEELMAKRIGNPFRIWGVGLVLVLVAVGYFGLSWLSGPMLTSLAKSNLETVNGATVDLEAVNLKLGESKLEVLGLAMADPQELDTNVFEGKRIVADLNTADLLRKRFSVDQLIVEDAATGQRRENPGKRIGPPPQTDRKIELPDFDDLGSVLENADIWKKRLAQAKRWLAKLTAGDAPKEESISWEEQLNSRIQSSGYANVKADFLTEGSPTFWIHRFEAKGVDAPYLGGIELDIIGSDLSTHPGLVAAPPMLSLDSEDDRLSAKLSLGGASGTGSNEVAMFLKAYPVDGFAASLKNSGEPVISGGTMDIDISGLIGALENDLVAQVTFDGAVARVGGNPVDLDGITLPLNIRGPLDSPGVKLESNALQRLLVSAGKKKLLDEAGKKLGLEGEVGDKPADLLKGLLDKKLGE